MLAYIALSALKKFTKKEKIDLPLEIITVLVLMPLFVLLFTGVPVAFALITSALISTLIFWTPAALYMSAMSIFVQSTKDIYIAIPLFVLMANTLESSGIGEDLFKIIFKLFPEVPGGLAVGAIVMCTLVDAMSGLGATGVVTIGILSLPQMLKHGYNKSLAVGCVPAGSSLGPLIPPSVLMIIIAGMMGLSVGKCFVAGAIPGFFIAFLFIAYIIVRCLIDPKLAPSLPIEQRVSWKVRLLSLKGIILPTVLVIAVLGSIYTGIATPTEAAGVGALGAVACGIINRRLKWANFRKALSASLRINGMVMWLLIGGSMFASMLNATGIANLIAQFMIGCEDATVALLLMMLIPLVMGMFIDGAAVSVICIPIFNNVVVSFGIEPYWFATLFTISLIAGYLTPPFGMNLFVTKGISPPEILIGDIYKGVMPFIFLEIIALVVVFIFPELALWLPSKMK